MVTKIFTTLLVLFLAQNVFSQPIIAEYFGIWTEPNQAWHEKFRDDTPFDKLNRLYISFGKIVRTQDNHFSIDFDGPESHALDVINRVKSVNPNAEIFIIVGGDNASSSYGGAAHDEQFALNVANFLKKYGLHGFDIDWETSLQTSNLNQLVKSLYDTLHPRGYKLTLDVWYYVHPSYDMNVLKNNLDQMNIMSYGVIRSLQTSVDAYEQAGFPISKLIGGIITESGYYGGTDTLGKNGTIAQKSQYALEHKMAGMMAWRLDNDYALKDRKHYPTYQGANELWMDMNGS